MSKDDQSAGKSVWSYAPLRALLGEIKRRYGVVDTLALPNMRDLPPLRIEQLFVQPLLSENPASAQVGAKGPSSGQSLLSLFHKQERIVVLGDPGSGKTTLANWLAWRLSSGLTASLPTALEGALPIPCVLREIGGEMLTDSTDVHALTMYIAARLLGERLNEPARDAIGKFLITGNYVLILDGIDEIPVEYRRHVARWVQEAAMVGAKLLATSRIVGYEDFPMHSITDVQSEHTWNFIQDSELVALPRSSDLEVSHFIPKSLAAPNHLPLFWYTSNLRNESIKAFEDGNKKVADVFYLLPFDESRIAAFIENWYFQRCNSELEAKQRKDDLLVALNQSSVTRDLARTPNLLSLMAIVHRERAHLPDGKALLYKEIANAYINTIDQHRKIPVGDALAPYGLEAKEGWIAYVGFRMQLERASEKTNSANSGVLVEEKKILSWLEHAMAQSGVPHPATVAPDFLRWVARRCGLLLPRGDQRFAFVHLSFQEYFCARYLAAKVVSPAFVRGRVTADGTVSEKLLKEWAVSPLWQESLIYLFEIVTGELGADWTEELAAVIFETEKDHPVEVTALASKALVDRHIQLSRERKRSIAEKSAWKAIEEMQSIAAGGDAAALRSFMSAGFASGYTGSLEYISLKDAPLQSSPDFSAVENPLDQLILFGKSHDVADVSNLQRMENLRAVSLADTAVVDILPISFLRRLRFLDLSSTSIADFSALQRLDRLEELLLSRSRPKDFSFLKGLKSLQILDLNDTGLELLPKFPPLDKLRWLKLERNKIADLSNLEALRALTVLFLNDTEVSDLAPLQAFNNLTILTIDSTFVSKLPRFPPKLRWLSISDTKVTDLRGVRNSSELEVLIASNTRILDIGELKYCESLRRIDLSDSPVADISPLCNLEKLEFLDISRTKVADFSPLTKLPNLREVWLVGGEAELDENQLPGVRVVRKNPFSVEQ